MQSNKKKSKNLRLTFEHRHFDGSTVGADAVAAHAHVGAGVGHLDFGDEQGPDVGALHPGLERRRHMNSESRLDT